MTLKQVYLQVNLQVQDAFKGSMTHKISNSHHLSQFAVFFIEARA